MTEQIEIRRDGWGVPHVMAHTERGAIFGQGYVQALDRLPSIYYAYRMALGNLTDALDGDWYELDSLQHLHDHAAIARREFANLPPDEQGLLAAFIAGIEQAIADHPALSEDERVEAWRLPQLEAWYPLALARAITYPYIINHIWAELGLDPPESGLRPLLSNLWAVGPQRTHDGLTLLGGDPHAFHSPDWLLHECGLYADGLAVYGFQHPAMPFIRFGHNQRVAWGFTSNGPNTATVVALSDPSPLDRVLQFDGKMWQIRTGYDGVLFDHITPLRALNRAGSVDDVRRVLATGQIGPWHVIAADADGDIFYQATGRVHRRDKRGKWGELHSPTDLPTLHNPPARFVTNANGSARTATLDAPFADVPDYLRHTTPTGFQDENTPRGRTFLRRLGATLAMTLDDALALMMNDAMPEGWLWRDAVLKVGDQIPDGEKLLAALAAWDGRARTDGPISRWLDDYLAVLEEDDPDRMMAIWERLLAGKPLNATQSAFLAELADAVPAPDAIEPIILARGPQRRPLNASDSLSIRIMGSVQSVPIRYQGRGGLAADYGQVAPLVVALGHDGVRSWAAVPYGQSDFPASPHYADQIDRFGRGVLRPTFFAKTADLATITILKRESW